MTPIDVTMTRLCIKGCGRVATRPVRKKWRRSYCQPCWQALPSNQRAQSTRLNQKRRAKARLFAQRIIRIGARRIGYVKTVEEARRINAHTRSRLDAFKQRQRQRTEAEAN